jgi:hypothetical protein
MGLAFAKMNGIIRMPSMVLGLNKGMVMINVNTNELVPVKWLATPYHAYNYLTDIKYGGSGDDHTGLAHELVGYWVDVTNVVDLDEPYGELVQLANDNQRHVAVVKNGTYVVSAAPLTAVYVDAGGQCWADKWAAKWGTDW